jgi:MFS family permease
MKLLPILAAGFAYFALGGLWFTPLFGRQWDKAVGFERPPKWRPAVVYYVGPLLGCLVAAFTTSYLVQLAKAQSVFDYLTIGLLVGIGYGATITTVNAISPNMRHPGLYAAVVGSYHLVGLVLCSAVLYWLS